MFGLYAAGLYVLQWSLRTSKTVLVETTGAGRGMWLLLAIQCSSPKTALKVLRPILCFSAQRRHWLTELSMAEGHQDDRGTGTWDTETLVERWVCPAHRRENCFFLQQFGECLQWWWSQIPLRDAQPPVLGEMGTSCRQLKSQLRSKTKPITIMRVINRWNGLLRGIVGSWSLVTKFSLTKPWPPYGFKVGFSFAGGFTLSGELDTWLPKIHFNLYYGTLPDFTSVDVF